MDRQQIVVIGAGYAGLMAALRLGGRTRRRAQVTLVNAAETFTERIRLHQLAAGQQLKARHIEPLARRRGVKFVQGTVTAIDLAGKALDIRTRQGTERLHYDTLVYALGSLIERDAVPGAREHAYTLSQNGERGADDLGVKLRGLPDGAAVTVAGGGLTGIEAATEFAETYPKLHFTLVTRGELAEGAAGDKARAYMRRSIERRGVRLVEGRGVAQIEAGAAVLADGTRLTQEALVWCGAFAVPALAKDAGLAVNARGQIVVDEFFRSASHPDVYAVGDCAAAAPIDGIRIRMSCQTAMPQGASAAEIIAARLAGRDAEPFRMAYYAHCVSLGRHDGIVDFANADDSSNGRLLTGRLAAFVKEAVCSFTFRALWLESFAPLFRWAKPREANPQAARVPAR